LGQLSTHAFFIQKQNDWDQDRVITSMFYFTRILGQ
jgi:hypothetical protein